MRATFVYKNHEIIVEKKLSSISLIIDGIEVDKKEGLFSVQNTNYELRGTVINSDNNSRDTVAIQFRYGMVVDEVVLLYNDDKIDAKRIV